MIESKIPRSVGVLFEDRHTGSPNSIEVPFTKVPGGIPSTAEDGSECGFLSSECVTMALNTCPVIGATG